MGRACDTVVIGGLKTIRATRAGLAHMMAIDCLAQREAGYTLLPKLVFSSNGQGISLAGTDPCFANLMGAADVIHADGMSVVIASRILTTMALPERIATTDFIHDAAPIAASRGLSFFMLGGSDAQNKAACDALQRLYPGLRLAGRHHGFIGPADDERLCSEIVASKADVLWVALGKPKQEEWCVRNRERLRGVAWAKTCGGLYAFLADDVRRAPPWMQDAGLEWLHRLLQEPLRLGWRYLVTNPHSIYRMVRFSG